MEHTIHPPIISHQLHPGLFASSSQGRPVETESLHFPEIGDKIAYWSHDTAAVILSPLRYIQH